MSKNRSSFIHDAAPHEALVSVAFRTLLALACLLAYLCTPLTMRLQSQQSSPQVIDGALNPEMIPDWRAYSVLFRFISNRTGEERKAILGYLNMIGLGGENCESCAVNPTLESEQIDVLIATAEEFSKGAADLDGSMKEALKRKPYLSPGSDELLRFQQDKERLCLQAIYLLSARLGLHDSEKVRLHIERMKHKMQLVRTVQAVP